MVQINKWIDKEDFNSDASMLWLLVHHSRYQLEFAVCIGFCGGKKIKETRENIKLEKMWTIA